jgi:hypothetical protein
MIGKEMEDVKEIKDAEKLRQALEASCANVFKSLKIVGLSELKRVGRNCRFGCPRLDV